MQSVFLIKEASPFELTLLESTRKQNFQEYEKNYFFMVYFTIKYSVLPTLAAC